MRYLETVFVVGDESAKRNCVVIFVQYQSVTISRLLLLQNFCFILLLQLLVRQHILRVFNGQVLHLEDEAPNRVRIDNQVGNNPHVVNGRFEVFGED